MSQLPASDDSSRSLKKRSGRQEVTKSTATPTSLDMPVRVAGSTFDPSSINTNVTTPLRLGLAVLILGFGGFLAWAGFAPLDAGVPADATVQVFGHRKVVQHLEGGIVDEILVHEGQLVSQGDPLLSLNQTRARAERNIISNQLINSKVLEARLMAERDELSGIDIDPLFAQRFGADDRYSRALKGQTELFQTRRKALEGEIEILQESLNGAQQQLEGLQLVQNNRRSQINFINRELEGVRKLASEGYLPRNRMYELERDAAQLNAALSDGEVEIGRVRNEIAQLNLRIIQRRQDFRKEVESELAEVHKETTSLTDRLSALDYTLARTVLLAPIDGRVQNLKTHTIGGVITPGTLLMEVVPEDEAFIVEAKVPVQSIDKIVPDLDVDIIFPAFSHAQTPNIPGRVLTISSDRLEDERTGMPYYLAQVEVTPEGMGLLEQHSIRPGMPATVMIKTGERTMLNYILKPFLDRLTVSFKEQ